MIDVSSESYRKVSAIDGKKIQIRHKLPNILGIIHIQIEYEYTIKKFE